MDNLTVLGTGVLGSQIAFQAAYKGKKVHAYDISDEALEALPGRWEQLRAAYLRDLPEATEAALDAARARISATTDLAEALEDADIVIEAVPERVDIKTDTWAKVAEVAPTHTIFCTNSSTLLPSTIAPATGRPGKFLALHFGNSIWTNNIAEVMGHAGTDPAAFEEVATFAEEIGMVPIRIHKEQPGYVLNSLLVPFLKAASHLFVGEVATPQDIDRTWRIATGAPLGPFEIFDVVGMMTPYALNSASDDPRDQEFARILKEDFIDKGYLGRAAGRGFYSYE